MTDVVELSRQLIDIPSVTGEEKAVGEFLLEFLQADGWECRSQEVATQRFNILASQGQPEILLTTHVDTVPPFFPSDEDANFLYGRGACDAKGIAAAMICAAQDLVEAGERTVGLLFVVGEETNSIGARKAQQLGLNCSFLIDGEPTDNELVIGHKGVVSVRVHARGVAAPLGLSGKG